MTGVPHASPGFAPGTYLCVHVRLPEKGDPNFHGARPVHRIITVIKWTRTSGLSMKNSLSPQSFWATVQPQQTEATLQESPVKVDVNKVCTRATCIPETARTAENPADSQQLGETSSFSSLLSSRELSYTNVYEP